MSASEIKRSKRRRNKRGGGGSGSKPSRQQKQTGIAIGDQIITAAKMSATLSELDLDSIPQPLTQLPSRATNPYLQDHEHCRLCRRQLPDLPTHKVSNTTGDGKDSNQSNITQGSPRLCPDCQQTYEEARSPVQNAEPSLLPQDFLLQPSFAPLFKLDSTFNVPTSLLAPTAAKGSEATCNCEPCRERREIAAEQEMVRQQLAESWSELSHVVRCVYWEAGTALAEDDDSSKLSLPRMKELLHRLCTHNPHQLFQQLELEVDDYLKEISGRLGQQLAAGYKSLNLAKQFVNLLLEEYDALCSAAKKLTGVLEQLEKEHLTKFQLTWLRHNMHMFHSTVYVTLGLREKFGCLIKELRQETGSKEACLMHRYLKFDEDMSVISVEWRDCQQLIDKYHEDQMTEDCLKTKLGADWEFLKSQKIFAEHGGLKGHTGKEQVTCHTTSSVLERLLNGSEAEHKGSTCKKRCPCDECSIATLTSRLLYEDISLKHLQEGGSQAIDNYLSVNAPDLSSTSSFSSESSSQDSDGVPRIFSRSDLTQSGFSSPRSEDSEDSDDLDSNKSPSPAHDSPTEDIGKHKADRRTNGDGSSSGKESYSQDGSQKETTSGSHSCTCRACTTSHKVLPSAFGIPDKLDLSTQASSYLFYPNLTNHQPLDLSHHGITAKHPFIHPHLYNPLTAQKPNNKTAACQLQQAPTPQQQHQHQQQHTPFQLNLDSQDALRDHLMPTYGDWKSGAFESAKMILNSRGYSGHTADSDPLQSVQAALHQSNCKAAAERASSSSMPTAEQPCKQHAGKTAKDQGKKKANHMCLETATTNGIAPPTATAEKQQATQHPYHHSNQSTENAKKSRADSSSDRCARHGLPTAKPPATTSTIIQAYQQQCSQAGHTSGMTNGVHGGGDAPPQGNKKKPEDDVVRVDTNMGLVIDGGHGDDRAVQSCIHHGHPPTSGIVDPQTSMCNNTMHTATSTPTSASVCSDPDCETHNLINDDDMYGGCFDDRGSSNGNRERESKHCDCCYCEFFGHGGPQLAPTSRNYAENRDRLRLKLRDRQKRQHEFDQFDHLDLSDERTLEDLLSFINGEKQREKSSAKTKAAKRHRQKQKKAEEKARLEEHQEALRQEELRRQREEKQKEEAVVAAAAEAEKIKQQRQQQEREKITKQLQQQQQHRPDKVEGHVTCLRKKKKQQILHEQQQQHQEQGKEEQGSKQQRQPQPQQQYRKCNQSNSQQITSNKPKQPNCHPSATKQVTVQQQQSVKPPEHQLLPPSQQQALSDPSNSSYAKGSAKAKQQQPQQGSKLDNTAATNNQQKNPKIQQSQQGKGKPTSEQDITQINNHKQNMKPTTKKSTDTGTESNHQLKKVVPQGPSTSKTSGGNKKAPQQENHRKQKDEAKLVNHIMSNTPPTLASHQSAKKDNNQIPLNKPEKVTVNGIVGEPQVSMSIKKKKKKRNSDNPNTSIDEIFLPKENADMTEMDETEREIEDFKRFCMSLTPAQNKEKVVFSMKELTIKCKGTVSAH